MLIDRFRCPGDFGEFELMAAEIRYQVGLFHDSNGEGYGLWRIVRSGKSVIPVSQDLIATFSSADEAALFLRFCEEGHSVSAIKATRDRLLL